MMINIWPANSRFFLLAIIFIVSSGEGMNFLRIKSIATNKAPLMAILVNRNKEGYVFRELGP